MFILSHLFNKDILYDAFKKFKHRMLCKNITQGRIWKISIKDGMGEKCMLCGLEAPALGRSLTEASKALGQPLCRLGRSGDFASS